MNKPLFIFKSIWLVDDDADDIELFEDALNQILPNQTLIKFSTGNDFLIALRSYNLPDLLFLDLSMPLINGFECLNAIKEQTKTRQLPVVVYSSSPNEIDIVRSYGLGASLYVKKPSSYKDILLTLDKVLKMDWNHPAQITNSQFVGGKYVPFRA